MFFDEVQDFVSVQNFFHNDRIGKVTHQCVICYALQVYFSVQNSWHKDYIGIVSPRCVFSDDLQVGVSV